MLERDASLWFWIFSVGDLQLHGSFSFPLSLSLSLSSRVFFPTEGKQMRLNINSRLLMQHCAKICAPAAWIERTARLKRKKKTPASSSSSSSPLSFSILPDEQLLGRQTEELVASCSAPQTERETIRFVHTHSWSSTFTAALLRSVPSPNTERERAPPPTFYQV